MIASPVVAPRAPAVEPPTRRPRRTEPLRARPEPLAVRSRRIAPLVAEPLPAEVVADERGAGGPPAEDALWDLLPPLDQRPPVASGPSPESAPPLLTCDGTVLPVPPAPPFARTATGWAAAVPSRLGRKVVVAVDADGIAFGAGRAAWEDIVHATVSLGASDDQGAQVAYDLQTRDGRTVRARTGSLSSRHAELLYDVADHVWAVLRVAVSPRLRAPLVAAVALGQTVDVAGLRLHRDGVAPTRKPDKVVPWRQLGDPIVNRRMVVVPAGVKVLQTPIASRDAVLLLDLLPELRAAKLRGDLG